MTLTTNPFNLEFRDVRGGRLVIYHNRNIARVTQDGTMIVSSREVNRNAAVLESLGLSRAMMLVEAEDHAEAILGWTGLSMFTVLKLDLYFTFPTDWFMSVIRQYAPMLQQLDEFEVGGPKTIDDETWAELQTLFPNTSRLSVLGRVRS